MSKPSVLASAAVSQTRMIRPGKPIARMSRSAHRASGKVSHLVSHRDPRTAWDRDTGGSYTHRRFGRCSGIHSTCFEQEESKMKKMGHMLDLFHPRPSLLAVAVLAAMLGFGDPRPAAADAPDAAAAAELAGILAAHPASADWNTVLAQVERAGALGDGGSSDGLDANVIAVGRGGQMTSIERWYQTVDGVRKSPTQQAVSDLVNMYYGSYWVFYDDGGLAIYHDTTYIRGDLTPTYGSYWSNGGRLGFSTERSSGGTNSANWLTVEGSLSAGANDSLVASVTHEVSIVMSACVMGSCYGQRHFKSIDFTLPVR